MKAFDRIYQALLDSQKGDEAWKKKVDKTFKKYVDEGMTPTQAMKHTAMELNEERTPVSSFNGFFLKSYTTRSGEKLVNIVVDDTAVILSGENDFEFPEMPCGLSGENVVKVRNLMSGKVYYEMNNKTVLVTKPLVVESLVGVARNIEDVDNETYALVNGSIVNLIPWKEPMVTPEQLNLKLNFRSGAIRSGFFVTNWQTIENVLPSADDLKRFKQLIDDSDFEGAVAFFNDVCSEQYEHKIPGMEILLFGKVVDNIWKDREGNERTGKNIRITVGGFVFSVDALFESIGDKTTQTSLPTEKPKPKKTKKPETKPESVEEEATEETAEEETDGDPFDVFTETPEPPAEDKKEGLEETLLALLKKAPKGLSPNEIKEQVDAPPKEIADMLSKLIERKSVALSSGKFQLT